MLKKELELSQEHAKHSQEELSVMEHKVDSLQTHLRRAEESLENQQVSFFEGQPHLFVVNMYSYEQAILILLMFGQLICTRGNFRLSYVSLTKGIIINDFLVSVCRLWCFENYVYSYSIVQKMEFTKVPTFLLKLMISLIFSVGMCETSCRKGGRN